MTTVCEVAFRAEYSPGNTRPRKNPEHSRHSPYQDKALEYNEMSRVKAKIFWVLSVSPSWIHSWLWMRPTLPQPLNLLGHFSSTSSSNNLPLLTSIILYIYVFFSSFPRWQLHSAIYAPSCARKQRSWTSSMVSTGIFPLRCSPQSLPVRTKSLTILHCRELKGFPRDSHWFCPRRNNDDPVDYDNPDEAEEDMSPETKQELIQDAKRRHQVAYKYSLILGLGQEISGHLLEDYTLRLNKLLTTCDKCVHNWHMGRKPYLKELAE